MSVRHKGFNHVMYFGPPLPPPHLCAFFHSLWNLRLCHRVGKETSVFNKIDAALVFLSCGPETLWVCANAK